MQRLAWLALIFALLFAICIVAPAFLNRQFPPYPLMKLGDVLDVVTPLVLISFYWLLFQINQDHTSNHKETLVFLGLAALWVEGQGMYLAANSISSSDQGHIRQ